MDKKTVDRPPIKINDFCVWKTSTSAIYKNASIFEFYINPVRPLKRENQMWHHLSQDPISFNGKVLLRTTIRKKTRVFLRRSQRLLACQSVKKMDFTTELMCTFFPLSNLTITGWPKSNLSSFMCPSISGSNLHLPSLN